MSSLLYYGNILYSFIFGLTRMTVKHFHFTAPAISQPGANLMTVLPAILVPACALLIVGAVTAVACVMTRRKSVAIKLRDKVDLTSANREETGAGLVDACTVKLRG